MSMKARSSPIEADPLWYKDAIIYQLHVKSFFDSNNDGVGDFAGLMEKLDYIADLGVTCVWLLPFYPSPRRDDGYDISAYKAVHPEYGKMSDIRRFVEQAHDRGIRVVTELVINHTSDQHPWFQRARKARPRSAARDFYVWSDTDQLYSGTRIIFLDTEKSNWTWDEEAKAYYWHRFYSHQPDLNFDNPRVLEKVLDVMRFWLDLGVDGLRLDAIPYLIERDGTSNENLAETHVILKKIRSALDAEYPDRMLLAEANMWPEDTQQYFGEGDECHVAFHFPLMPRMYMAIAQEDRFPITDIMRQTPDIPANCQWAIFLRNHDELTLEMVTDKERDYLWNTYATDRKARINLGIRRRLAPLMERDRRRIELMNCLLLTMPGTPVLYYGDEIGMGDNIHLGDRDGVRTPMQWSSDRNGGFSRTDPASMVLPAIMDPLYGYEAVNVEAQWRDPHSLLNWVRRMLAVRRRHQAFGRGTQRFLRPRNRKVLAYLRELDGEAFLCVANVSRTAQAVELELSEFAGRVPFELSGGGAFPAIGQLTYLLTLPPYGFYWFQLAKDVAPPAWSTASPSDMTEQHTFVVRNGISDIVSNRSRDTLLSEVLPPYVQLRRWFQGKASKIESIDLSASEALPSIAGEALYAELIVTADGTSDRYTLPLTVAWEDEPNNPFEAPLSLARVRRGRRVGLLTDAFASPRFARAILEGLETDTDLSLSDGGSLSFRSTPAFAGANIPLDAEIEWLAAEWTNSTLIVGRKAVVKLLRRLSPGIHPEAEMNRFLTLGGFAGSPPMWGEVVRTDADGTPYTVALVQGYAQNQGDGWAWTLTRLDWVVDDNATPFGNGGEDEFDAYRTFAATLGKRLGEMHALLASPTDDEDFAAIEVDAATARAWAEAARTQLEHAFELLGPIPVSDAQNVLARRDALLGRISETERVAVGSMKTRIHGDLHLGQILVAAHDVMIIDFEGEPLKPLSERRAKSSPMRDIAGLLRSFDYAAAAVARNSRIAENSVAKDKSAELLQHFRRIARSGLLEGYAAGRGQPLTAQDLELVELFAIEKAAYEVVYEIANRPDWLDVPLKGLLALSDQPGTLSGASNVS